MSVASQIAISLSLSLSLPFSLTITCTHNYIYTQSHNNNKKKTHKTAPCTLGPLILIDLFLCARSRRWRGRAASQSPRAHSVITSRVAPIRAQRSRATRSRAECAPPPARTSTVQVRGDRVILFVSVASSLSFFLSLSFSLSLFLSLSLSLFVSLCLSSPRDRCTPL